MDPDMRKYLIAMSSFAGVWGSLSAFGVMGPIAPIVLVLGVLVGGFAYLGPRAMALGFGVHVGADVGRGLYGRGQGAGGVRGRMPTWKPPPLGNHMLTYEAPLGMLVHQYRGVRIMHDTPFSHLDVISCEMCKQEGIKRWPEGADALEFKAGDLVIKTDVQRKVRPFWPRP